ncbi:MAG: tRNA 2-selenouridine(34) synthase MnmH, partial [Parvularculaceae bacterium]|nr:tRNA 2-selenouridine(34) synthase MnmH [Parvularculaceae bacterium]
MAVDRETVDDLSIASRARFDAVIDVRSPSEFAEDHIPGAVNLPVLDDDERAEVGTIYVRQSRFLARRRGAALVSRNIARHLEGALGDKPSSFRPLLYCWRGGMRSGAMATVLGEVGWRVGVVAGGYKTWRSAVVEALLKSRAPLRLVLLDGQTGSAKTDLLRRAAKAGAQILDLEALARHRGSVFGADPERGQPTQKQFESDIFESLCGLDTARTILVEAESARIGALSLPRRLWSAMRGAPRIEIEAPRAERARRIVQSYADITADADRLSTMIDRLRPFHAKETVDAWRALAAARALERLAEALIEAHYDPLYERARRKRADSPLLRIALTLLAILAVAMRPAMAQSI